MCKTSKTCPIEIYSQRLVRSTESVYTHIELSASKKQWIEEIPLAYVWFWWIIAVKRFPSRNFAYFIKNEDPFSLAF
jgi:hypothetical protein